MIWATFFYRSRNASSEIPGNGRAERKIAVFAGYIFPEM